jgi:hypothetical protein
MGPKTDAVGHLAWSEKPHRIEDCQGPRTAIYLDVAAKN